MGKLLLTVGMVLLGFFFGVGAVGLKSAGTKFAFKGSLENELSVRQEAQLAHRKTAWLMILMLAAIAETPAQTAKKISLSLDDCLVRAIRTNLEVAVEVINPQLAGLSVSGAKEKFLPALSFAFQRSHTNQASYSWIQAADQLLSTYSDYSAGVSQLIPTGGKVDLSLESYRNDSNAQFQTINPYYGSTLTFNFTQPLLKGFGFTASRKEILVAENNEKISQNDFKDVLLRTINNVDEAYWNLVYSIDALEVSRQSLQLAEGLLEKNRKEIDRKSVV